MLILFYPVYRRVKVIDCYQFEDCNHRSPILPPDEQGCPQRGYKYRIKYRTAGDARNAYREAMSLNSNRRKQRKYLQGSRYIDTFKDNCCIIDVRNYDGMVDLNIRLESGETSTLKIRDLSNENEFMTVVKNFNQSSSKTSEARCHAGDFGKMFAFGLHNLKDGDYISMRKNKDGIRKYSLKAREVLEKYFKSEIMDIIEADKKQGIVPSNDMGGTRGISAYALVSRDLINAAHYDLDTSFGLSVFNEKNIGAAKGWYFVLPNTIIDGGNVNKAIVIELFDGCTLAWDGRKIFHCTAAKEIGENNHLYGNYWGGKTYK